MNKLLIICGPTAVGKTALGVRLAKQLSAKGGPASGGSGEIVSADSRQVYRYMDIGTGKDHPKTATVHLVDIVDPDEEFSVAHYYKLASGTIRDIWKRGRLPILVGGTGFYIKAVVDGIETIGIKPDWKLREKLRNLEIEKLREKLRRLDSKKWEGMNESDRKNPRRLIRAIEIALKLKTRFSTRRLAGRKLATKVASMSKLKTTTQISKLSDILMIGLTAPNKILYQRIDGRVEERVKQGVIGEIEELLTKGYSWDNSVLGETIGYKEWRSYFEGKEEREKVIEKWKYDEHALTRRQMTWFKKDKRISWFDISKKGWENKINKAVKKWYTE